MTQGNRFLFMNEKKIKALSMQTDKHVRFSFGAKQFLDCIESSEP